ncbi:trypsin-1 [Folsomia candida]|uniref:limulus clotting factor C n=1 Tax=Folsomia candida TaxID=158441 RepID=A0A226EK44_FOLCA|nr:trypsin-1 [Folsomia candida]OXA58083.1 Venom serine protease 34 [Folsomia candida]
MWIPFLLLGGWSLLGIANAQTAGCDIYHEFKSAGQSATLQSPGYPSSYPPNTECRYTITSPIDTQMTISCNEFNVEASTNCVYDVLFLSPSGDSTFKDQEFFCGQGSWTRTSSANRFAIGFHSDSSNPTSSQPYRFQCTITVVEKVQPSCNCGQSNSGMSRIVGGSNSAIGEFPWRVSLYSVKLGVFCGGTIISNNFVLTAAHCTNSVEPGDTIYVNAGDYDLSSSTDTQNQLIPVDYVVQNTMYNDQTQDSDISLLRLQTPLVYNSNVGPVCLPWNYINTDFNGKLVTASGWGTQYFGGGISPTLKKVEIPVLETQPCADKYAGTHITITNNMICTYYPGRDTCQGDSGGSIDYKNTTTGRWTAIGVTSQGISCGQADQPGVYSKIVRFLTWIQGNTGESFCKA